MTKYLIVGLLAFSTVASLTCCKMFGHHRKGNPMEIHLSGKKLAVDDVQGEELFQLLQSDLVGCSDIYQLIVTQKLIDDIEKDNEYLEIRFANQQEIVQKSGEKVAFNKMLVPLTGEYATEDQLTFFLSNNKVHHTPYINTNGLKELTSRLHGLE